ncbi:MAG: glutamine amidotransferase [Polyangiaceae bacterium]
MGITRAIAGLLGVAIPALSGCALGTSGLYSATENGSQPVTGTNASTIKSVAILGTPGAFDENALLGFLNEYPLSVTRVDLISAHLTERTLAPYDVVVIDNLSRTFQPDEATVFEAWVRAGGSVLALTGHVSTDRIDDVDRPNSLLARLPIMYLPGVVQRTTFGYVSAFTKHPATAGLAHVGFWGGFRVELLGKCDGPSEVVASLDDHTPVGVACQHGAGRVFVWGDEWVEYSSQWTKDSGVPRFWKSAVDWLTHRT